MLGTCVGGPMNGVTITVPTGVSLVIFDGMEPGSQYRIDYDPKTRDYTKLTYRPPYFAPPLTKRERLARLVHRLAARLDPSLSHDSRDY